MQKFAFIVEHHQLRNQVFGQDALFLTWFISKLRHDISQLLFLILWISAWNTFNEVEIPTCSYGWRLESLKLVALFVRKYTEG